jgi:polysaccharide pyruvyl transferase CsaB
MGNQQVVLCGYYGFGNGGDEALLATLLQMLPPQVTPVVLSGNPALTTKQHGVAACDRKRPLEVFNLLRRSQGFIWGGGSLMQDTTSALSPVYYASLMGISQCLGLKTVAWAQGIGPLQRSTSQWLAKQMFQGCTAVSVRDQGSMAQLKQWGVKGKLGADPVWALEALPYPALMALPSPRIAVSLRSHPQLTPERLAVLTQALVSLQQATQAFMVLLPFQISEDLEIAQSLQAQLPNCSQIFKVSDPRQLKGVFQGVEMAIAMRLHGLIMAAGEGCRCFALSYDPKVTRLMAECDLPGYELSALPSDANLISQAWLEVFTTGRSLTDLQQRSLVEGAEIHQALLSSVFDS